MDIEIKEASVAEISEESTQKWISVKDAIPQWGGEGAWGGDYLCIVERPSNPRSFGHVEGGVSRTVELCYYNDLAKRWQDSEREWVKVTHWTQIAKLPFHKSIHMSREEMLLRIDSGELKSVYHMKETDEGYQSSMRIVFAGISYDEPLYYSSTRSGHIEDYMYAISNK